MPINSEKELIEQKLVVAGLVKCRLDASLFEFGGNERLKMIFDLEAHLAFLGEALRCQTPKLFTEYAVWTHQLLLTSGGDPEKFKNCLLQIDAQILESGSGTWVAMARHYLGEAISQLDSKPPLMESYIAEDNPHGALARDFLNGCLALKRDQAMALIANAVKDGVSVYDIYLNVITPAMYELGRFWHLNRITVAHEHYCTAVAQMVMAQLFPSIFDGSTKKGRLVATCVAGELHEIGARMVSDLFEMNGWDTVFLGADVPTETVIDTLVELDAHALAVSVTLASHLGSLSEIIAAVRANPACARVRILVGGAACNIDSSLWRRLGADGWAQDGASAITLAEQWKR